jgi:hypothetical protein
MRLRPPRFIVIVTCDLPIRAVAFDHQADHLFRWTTIELESGLGGTPTQAEHHRAIEAKISPGSPTVLALRRTRPASVEMTAPSPLPTIVHKPTRGTK